ncbi:MAG: DNA internalization-related competence protein ComEC/Rec2 [Proteobacteria bacterium]|nr:MAG: DNA internalization-related competence protein ComEC/Rec2 [Pseudomonadota bacterium]
MQMAIVGMLAALLVVQHSASLLPLAACALLGVACLACVLVAWGLHPGPRRTLACLALGVTFGLAYGGARGHWRLADQLDAALDGSTVSLHGHVVGLPTASPDSLRFLFAPASPPPGVPTRLSVSWYPKPGTPLPTLVAGQGLVADLRLKVIHGQHNPGGFDYAGWQFARGVGGVGYVKQLTLAGPPPDGVAGAVDRWRQSIRARIDAHVPAETAALLTAMAVGDQSGISDPAWRVLRHTGTAHLVAISGLHVSIVALLVGGLAGWAWRRSAIAVLHLPAQRVAVLAAAVAGVAYGAMAGFGVPVTRSVLMLLVACAALWSARHPPPGNVLLLALLGVMLFDPWCVLAAGFWLSFGAVGALIMILSGRRGRGARWERFAAAQLAVTLLTAPVLLVLFGQVSLVSPLANAVAIPLVSLLVVPLLLAGVFLPFDLPLGLAAWLMARLMDVLGWGAALPFSAAAFATPPLPLMALALAGGLWGLLPHGTPWRTLGWLAWMPAVLWMPPRPDVGGFEARVLDVGQGLAVHLRTAGHDLLYDTGPGYFRGGDAGERHVVPYLQGLGVGPLDLLVVSHGDKDHAGGAASVLADVGAVQTVAGEGVDLPGKPARCAAGGAWTWDGVTFRWLHPAHDAVYRDDNDRSCVLWVSSAGGSLLLTGDVTARVERQLAEAGGWPRSDVVVAPHHGSRSSSSEALVAAAAARHVVFSAGYRNPFGHPVEAVVSRWQDAGARAWRTDRHGAIRIAVDATGVRLDAETDTARRYWHRPRSAGARLATPAPIE